MNFRHVGTAAGREIFVSGAPYDEHSAKPIGYSIAAVVLPEGWKSDELGSMLNELYGALTDWTPFDPSAGARSFVFYGERADEASSLCDAFAYAWTKGVQEQYNDVIASSNDAPDAEAFIQSMFSNEITVGDAYIDTLRNMLFIVPPELTDTVASAAEQHHFD